MTGTSTARPKPRAAAPAATQGAPSAFLHPVRVYYEDTDAAGVVYYANFLKFMERARTEWLSTRGTTPGELARDRALVFVVSHVDIHYRAPARLGDLLDVGVAPVECRGPRLLLRQDVTREGDTLVEATVTLACVDAASMKPRRIPEDLLEPSN